jgi:NitT/TauT family transport system substrate-binding protein
LGRESGDGFRWDSLSGATVIPVGFSAMPWASFQFALRKNGVDPQSLSLIPDLPLPDAVAAFKSGQGDFIHLPEPAAEQLIADGTASLSVALGPVNGHIAYSSFAAAEAYLERNTETVHRFIRGYARGLTWLRENDPATVGDAVSGFFPDVPSELITKSVARYKEQGTWPATPHLEQPEFEGLQEILMGAGMVKEHQPYAKIVRPELVREALA